MEEVTSEMINETPYAKVLGLCIGVLAVLLVVALVGCAEAKQEKAPERDTPVMECSDSPYAPASTTAPAEAVKASVVIAGEQKKQEDPEDPEIPEDPEYYEPDYQEGGYYAEYDPAYNTDGPSRTMPGWYEGSIETYYSSNVLHHYRTDEWTPDDEGFYRDSEGRYVVGVGANDVNPETGEAYQIGDVVQTGKGEGVVMDYGGGSNVHDFYTNW